MYILVDKTIPIRDFDQAHILLDIIAIDTRGICMQIVNKSISLSDLCGDKPLSISVFKYLVECS